MNIENYISSGVIEQYVMGLCTAEEKNELEQMRRSSAKLDEAIRQFEIVFEKKMMNNISLPDTATDIRIMQTIDAMSQAKIIPLNSTEKKAPGFKWLKSLAAAASILLAISVTLNYYLFKKQKAQEQLLFSKNETPTSLPVSDYNILKRTDITPIAMYGVGYHSICRCTMFWDKKTGKVYIMIHHLPKSSGAEDFQLWAMVNNKPVSVGIINDTIRDRFIEMPNMPDGATKFSITLEKAGGSSSPTIDETYLEGKI